MKTKHEWTNKPVTWGQYLKLGGIVGAIVLVIETAVIAWVFWGSIMERLDSIIDAIKTNFNKI